MSGRSRKGLSGRRRYVAAAGFAAALVVTDQVTKSLVLHHLWPGRLVEVGPGFFNLTLCRNTGGAFSLLPDRPIVFTVLSVLAVGLLCYLFTRLRSPGASFAAAAILAGALGNLADRFRHGYVVDFLDLHLGPWHWYVFNVADAAITLGALALFVLTLVDERRRSRESAARPAPGSSENA